MEHPFVTGLSEKSLEELQTTMSNLTTKLHFAYRMQNGPMIHQLTMVLENYKNEYNKKMDEMIKKQNIQGAIKVRKEGEIDS